MSHPTSLSIKKIVSIEQELHITMELTRSFPLSLTLRPINHYLKFQDVNLEVVDGDVMLL